MKKFKYICIVMFLFSCTRQQIKISAVNPATGEPYAGLNYIISKTNPGVFETHSHVVKKGVLNESGNALVTLNLDNNRSYVIGLESPGEFCYINNISYTFSHNFSNTDKPFDFVFKIAPCAFVKLSIHNINCQGVGDVMRFRVRTVGESDFESWSSERMGCYSFDGSEFIKVPMGWRIYEWEVTKNGVTNYFSDSVYVAENQNNTFVINY